MNPKIESQEAYPIQCPSSAFTTSKVKCNQSGTKLNRLKLRINEGQND